MRFTWFKIKNSSEETLIYFEQRNFRSISRMLSLTNNCYIWQNEICWKEIQWNEMNWISVERRYFLWNIISCNRTFFFIHVVAFRIQKNCFLLPLKTELWLKSLMNRMMLFTSSSLNLKSLPIPNLMFVSTIIPVVCTCDATSETTSLSSPSVSSLQSISLSIISSN